MVEDISFRGEKQVTFFAFDGGFLFHGVMKIGELCELLVVTQIFPKVNFLVPFTLICSVVCLLIFFVVLAWSCILLAVAMVQQAHGARFSHALPH